jgi:hypothetical protein
LQVSELKAPSNTAGALIGDAHKPLPPTSLLIAAKDCDASLQPPCLHHGRLAF